MANAHFLVGLQGTLSGGAWSDAYPLSNLLTTQPGKKARSTNDSEASTLFVLDFGSAQSLQMFAFVDHNFSQGASIRVRVSDNSDGSSPSLDETFTVNIASVVWGSLPWGAFPWDGVVDEFPGGYISFYLHASEVSGRYVLINISNESNLDGYVEAGCFLAGVPFVPGINVGFGAAIGLIDDSTPERSAAGGLYADSKPKRRRVVGPVDYLSEEEALDDVTALQESVGRSKGVLFILDPEEDPGIRMRRSIYGSFTELAAIEDRPIEEKPYGWAFAFEELI